MVEGERPPQRGESFFDDCPDLCVVAGPTGRIEQVNEAWAALLGLDAGFLVEKPLVELACAEDRAVMEAALATLDAPGKRASWDARIADKDGAIRWLAWACRRGSLGKRLTATAREITRARAEEAERAQAFKKTTGLLQTLLDNCPLILWSAGLDGVFTFSEGLGLSKNNLKPGELVGRSSRDIFPDATESQQNIQRALLGESSSRRLEVGPLVWQSHILPMRDEAGQIIGVYGISLEVTESVQREIELQRRLEVIERQQGAIRSMGTPIIQVWDDVLALPIIGVVDSGRADEIMASLLDAIVRTRARYAILDLTGVEAVDTATADHLIKVIHAVRLLGARGIVTGVQPMVAQVMVALGVELSGVATLRNLRDAIKIRIRRAEPR